MINRIKKGVFIAGTDTHVGKTIFTALLFYALKQKGIHAITQKWIQTGDTSEESDIQKHGLFFQNEIGRYPKRLIKEQEPYRFKEPFSPHLAAQKNDITIDKYRIINYFQTLHHQYEMVIVEGSGGVLVPFSESTCIIEIVKELHLPVIIVAENRVGAINHTLLTIETCRSRNIPIVGVVFNQRDKDIPFEVIEDNPKSVEAISNIPLFGTLPYCSDLKKLLYSFSPIAEKIIACLQGGVSVPQEAGGY